MKGRAVQEFVGHVFDRLLVQFSVKHPDLAAHYAANALIVAAIIVAGVIAIWFAVKLYRAIAAVLADVLGGVATVCGGQTDLAHQYRQTLANERELRRLLNK